MASNAHRTEGFSLVELMIGLIIFGVLLSFALPRFAEWMSNIRVRNQADSLLGALQQARAEALRRNFFVRFQLVSPEVDGSLGSNCKVVSTSNRWVVSHGDPTDSCQQAQSQALPADNNLYSATPVLLIRGVQESPQGTVQTVMTLTQLDGSIIADPVGGMGHPLCFSPSGQLTRYDAVSRNCTTSMNPGTTTIARAMINVSGIDLNGNSLCAPGGPVRCLRIAVGSSGETRLCDPAMPQLAARNPGLANPPLNQRDVRGCFCDPSVGNNLSPDYCFE